MSAEGPHSLIEETVAGHRKGRPRTMDGSRTEQNRGHLLRYTDHAESTLESIAILFNEHCWVVGTSNIV